MVKQNTNAWSKVYRKQCKVERGILTRSENISDYTTL